MGEGPKQYWDKAHQRDTEAEWLNRPSLFAESVIQYFPEGGDVLDAGCGQGQDTRFFASKGYNVVGIDFSTEAIQYARSKTSPEFADRIAYIEANLSEPLPFEDAAFDAVHSHLASHYFSVEDTQRLFDEYARVLKPHGILTLLTNSVHHPQYGKWPPVEEDYFDVDGVKRRYFSATSLEKFLGAFEALVLDESGETHKDRTTGTSHLVRFVGRKKLQNDTLE